MIKTGFKDGTSETRATVYPFCVKLTFFSGRMERIWFRTWSGLVWLVRVTLYCGCKKNPPNNKKTNPDLLRTRCAEERRYQVIFCTLILRGPSRCARLLFGVSMLIILSRPLSREPKTFPPRFFFPLSPVTAMSRDRDLGRTSVRWNLGFSKCDIETL